MEINCYITGYTLFVLTLVINAHNALFCDGYDYGDYGGAHFSKS